MTSCTFSSCNLTRSAGSMEQTQTGGGVVVRTDEAGGHQSTARSALLWGVVATVGALAGYAIGGGPKGALIGAAAATGWEYSWLLYRRQQRDVVFKQALEHARAIGKPLVVIGAPDRGGRASSGQSLCGDIMIDVAPSSVCPLTIQADIGKKIPLPDDSAVVYVAYVLEYVDDLANAVRELERVAPGRVHFLRVQPWTATAYLFQGAQRRLSSNLFRATNGSRATS